MAHKLERCGHVRGYNTFGACRAWPETAESAWPNTFGPLQIFRDEQYYIADDDLVNNMKLILYDELSSRYNSSVLDNI